MKFNIKDYTLGGVVPSIFEHREKSIHIGFITNIKKVTTLLGCLVGINSLQYDDKYYTITKFLMDIRYKEDTAVVKLDLELED